MDSMGQFEEGNFSNGLLPPLRELFLEIQVNQLIKKYLFSSTTDERAKSLYDVETGSSEYKENKVWFTLPDQLYAKDTVLWSACSAPYLQSVGAFNDRGLHSPHEPHSPHKSTGSLNLSHMQSSQESHSTTCVNDTNINVKKQTVSSNAQSRQVIDAVCDASLVMENEDKKLHKAFHLSRVDTFPCAKKVELQVGAQCKMDTEAKPSCKKPPRPPRLPKLHSNELGTNLTRCSSDSAAHLQNSRRAKLERNKKAAGSCGNTSIWALVFTVCFAIIMIAQGFLSEDSQGYAMYGSDVSLPMETIMEARALVAPGEVGAEGGQARIEGIPVQSYVVRKVKEQYLSDMKHLELEKS